MTVRKVVALNDEFACPICGQEYRLESHDDTVVVAVLAGNKPCQHLDLEILPLQGSKWEVYFVTYDD